MNVLHIRALVKADTVVLFDTYGSADSRLHSVFLYHLEVRLLDPSLMRGRLIRGLAFKHNLKAKNSGPPYEFR